MWKALFQAQKNQLTAKSNWLIYISVMMGHARFERAAIALKVHYQRIEAT